MADGGFFDGLLDNLGDLAGDVTQAAGTYVKDKVKSALPDTQPAVHTGATGTGGTSAVPAGSTATNPVTSTMPKWVLPAAAATAAVVVLGVVVALVRR